MSGSIQTVTLHSEQHFGKQLPPKAFGELLRVLPEAIRFSIRMAFESRSQAKGKRPDWLTAASDIRFLDHSGDDHTVLHFAVPQLGQAAEVLYRQRELWPTRPEPTDNGFDLFADVISDVAAGNADSDRFDRQLLQQIERFKNGLNGTFQRLEFTGNRISASTPAIINSGIVETASRLSHNTPEPQQTRIVGTLDMIRSSTNTFAIKLKHGEEVRGVLTEGKVSQFTELVEQDVLILGKAIYRPSGKLLRIDADEVIPAGDHDRFFETIPKPKRSRFDLREVICEQKHKRGVAAIYGKWPGDESDEDIESALKEIN
jgi:hypothetical protein